MSFQPVEKDLKVILSPHEHPVNWVFMQATWAQGGWSPGNFSRQRGLFQWHRGRLPPFPANLITASPVLLAYISTLRWQAYIAARKQSLTTWSKTWDMETSTVLVSAKMKGKTKPWFGEPGRWHSRVEDCLEERRGGGKGLLLWGQIFLALLQFRWSTTAACPQYNSDGCRSDTITTHISCTANS